MNKHVLMLTAATVALMSGPAYAATTTGCDSSNTDDYTSITSKVTVQLCTANANKGSAGNITIGDSTTPTDGSVVVAVANPVIEINSDNTVKIATVGSTVSNANTTSAIGIQLDGTTAGNGPGAGMLALDSYGSIDLTGSGTGKTGILITAPDGAGDIFRGGITLEDGSVLNVTGDSSYGIHGETGTTLNGNVTILGSLTVTPTTATSTTSGAVTGIRLDNAVVGNIDIGDTGVISASGYQASGVVLTGGVLGSFTNSGSISAVGSKTAQTSAANPEAGSALAIGKGIWGGIYNAGPLNTSDSTVRATITSGGAGPALLISPSAGANASPTPITIGVYSGLLGDQYSFINRGTVSATPLDADISSTGMTIIGNDSTNTVTFTGGIYNAGTISTSAKTDAKATTTITATALTIGDYADIPNSLSFPALMNSGIESGQGIISATVSGPKTGIATAVEIGEFGSLPSISNSGQITASATTTDTTITSLSAYAIQDNSGTLANIYNTGSITATATTLDNKAQTAVAIDVSVAKGAVHILNTGTITGDILLGSSNDTVTVQGTSAQAASITGDISFNGGIDKLTIGDYGTVSGALTERGGGAVDVTVGNGSGTGTLDLANTATGLSVGNMTVNSGGTLNVSVSQAFNSASSAYVGPVITSASGTISLASNSNFGLKFGSFISTPTGVQNANFILLDAPINNLHLANYSTISNAINGTGTIAGQIPYLFTGELCTYNVAGTNSCGSGGPSDRSELVLQLTPKTIGTGTNQIPLTGDAARIFGYANAALANDDTLGSAVVTDVIDGPTAQAAYQAFVPDLSGSTRAVAISLTDQATGMVGARQRALRMYAGQDGGTTMWGQEFVQRLVSGDNSESFRASGFGFALGADGGSPAAGRYGGAFTFFSGDQTNKATNFNKTTNEWYMLTGYTDWRGKGLFLDTQLGFGYGDLKGRRSIALTDSSGDSLTRTAESKRAGLLGTAGVSTGAIFTYGGTVLTPQISFDALSMREEGYTESGGGDGYDLRVQPYYASSARGYVGGTVRQDIDLGDFYIQPELRAGYRYDFLADPVKLKAAFASVGDNFTLIGPDPERSTIIGGGSFAVTTGAWSIGFNYDYLRGTHGDVSQTGTLTLVGRL